MATSAVRHLAEVAVRATSSQAPAQFENNASASAVYHQPLCLGNILSNLPLSDLRSVQLVNRHGWREASRVMYRMVSVKMMDDIKPSPDNGAYYLSLVRVLDDPSITRKREQPELLEGYKKVYKSLHKYLGARRLDPYDNCSLADLALVRIDYCDYHFTTDVTDTENGATRITAHVHLMSRIRKQDWLKGQQVVLPIMSLEKEWDKVEQIPHIGFAPEAGENDGFSDMSQEDDLFFLAGQGKAPSTDADAKEALREEAERAITAHLIDASTLHPDVYMISLRDFEIGLDLKGLGRLCVNRRAFKGVRKISRVHTNLGTSRYEKFSLKKWRRFIKDAGPDLIDLRLFSDGYHVIHWPVLELDRLTSDVLDYCPHLQELHVGLATPESGKVVGLDIYWLDAEWGNDTVEELHLELATDLLRGRKSTPFPLLALSLSLAPIMAKGGRIVLTDQVGMHYWVEQKAAVELHHFQPEINRCVQYLLSLNPATQARIRQVDVKSLRYTASCLDDLKNLLPID